MSISFNELKQSILDDLKGKGVKGIFDLAVKPKTAGRHESVLLVYVDSAEFRGKLPKECKGWTLEEVPARNHPKSDA